MITEEDYLKAKKLVVEYESKQLKQAGVNRQVCEHGGFPFSTDHMCTHYDQCITGVRSSKVKECCIDWQTKRKLAGKA